MYLDVTESVRNIGSMIMSNHIDCFLHYFISINTEKNHEKYAAIVDFSVCREQPTKLLISTNHSSQNGWTVPERWREGGKMSYNCLTKGAFWPFFRF